MKRLKKYTILTMSVIILVILYFVTSSIFTEITFPNEFEVENKEAYLSYLETEKYSCDNQRDIEIKFKYKFPFVNFKGRIDVFLKKNKRNRVLYSGTYKKTLRIKDVCLDSLNGKLLLCFTRKKDGGQCWFHNSQDIENYKKNEFIELYIPNFNIGENDFKILD